MTVSFYLSNIADSISSISVSGVTVKDKDQIAGSWASLPNVLFPNPEDWITNFSMRYDTVNQGAEAAITINYTLNYRFLGVQVGDLSAFTVSYSSLVDKLVLIVNAMIATDKPYSGRVQMSVGEISIGPKIDPAGNNYFGADIALNIEEMQN